MGDVDVLRAQVVRRDASEPWGFRLQGGSDIGQPLSIIRVRTCPVMRLINATTSLLKIARAAVVNYFAFA